MKYANAINRNTTEHRFTTSYRLYSGSSTCCSPLVAKGGNAGAAPRFAQLN